jgi:hypothetical protein
MHQDKIVVDPSMIEVKGWQQFDYNSFWVNLISTFPTILVATPNWEYSRGARYEVSHALSHHIEILQLDGSIITQTDAESQARKAIDFLIEQGLGGQEVEYCLPPLRDPPEQTMSAASQCFEWLVREREYQVNKFGTDLDDEHSLQGFGDDSWWWQQLTNYYHRSKVLGVDTPGGRQAIAKFSATSCGLLESVIRIYGPLPQPGVSSGEIQW